MPLLDKQGIHAGCRWELSSHVFSSVLSFTHASLKLAHETEHGGNSSWNTARETPAGKELGLSSWSCSRWSIDSASPFYDYHKLALSSLNTHAPGIAVKERNLHFKKSSLIVSEQFHGGKFPERDTRVRRTPLSERSAGTPRGAEPRERLRNANSDARRGPTGLRAAQTPPSRAEPRAETQNRRPGTGTGTHRTPARTHHPPQRGDGTGPDPPPYPLRSDPHPPPAKPLLPPSRRAPPPQLPHWAPSGSPALTAGRRSRAKFHGRTPRRRTRSEPRHPALLPLPGVAGPLLSVPPGSPTAPAPVQAPAPRARHSSVCRGRKGAASQSSAAGRCRAEPSRSMAGGRGDR